MEKVKIKKRYKYHTEGKCLIGKTQYIGKKRHVLCIRYYPSGNKLSEKDFKNGIIDGKVTQWIKVWSCSIGMLLEK